MQTLRVDVEIGRPQPAPSSRQPPSLLFSEAGGDSLLLGFAEAWLPGGCG